MRRVAYGLLVASALGGCNQIFGLDETKARPDAPIPPDAMWLTIDLGLLRLTYDQNVATPAPEFLPIPDLMSVQAATADGPLVTVATDATSKVAIPIDISMAGPFRLVYQRTGGIPHEYQGLVTDARVVDPLWGPIARTAVPANAGWKITPAGASPNHALTRVFTTGVWTEARTVQVIPPGPTFDYGFVAPTTVSMSGPLGLPAETDAGVLADYANADSCESAIGSSRFDVKNAAAHAAVTGETWDSAKDPRRVTTPGNIALPSRIIPFGDEANPVFRENYGFVPSQRMPAFTRPAPGGLGPLALLRNPVMTVVRSCSVLNPVMATDNVHRPRLFRETMLEAVYTETTVDRVVAGIPLTNGLGALTLFPTGQATATVATDVAFPDAVKLTAKSGTVTDLFAADSVDQIAVPASTDAWTLSWGWAGDTGKADYWEVQLLEMTSPYPTARKTYATTNATKAGVKTTTSVRIDPADLVAGKHYVFQINAYVGRPDAGTGNYETVFGNQSMSVVHSHTIRIQ